MTMNNQNVSKFIKKTKTTLTKHSPEILTAIGIAGMFTTTILAVKATPKALIILDEKREEVGDYNLTKKEVVQTTWKCYIPAAVTGAASVICLIGANSVHTRRTAALVTMCKMSETALTEYREKVIETIGKEKEKEVMDKVSESRIKKQPVSKSEIIVTGKGNTQCFDIFAGRYFDSDMDTINKAVNEVNRQLLNEMYISLNTFYNKLGLSSTDLGEKVGWKLDDGLIEVYFSAQVSDDEKPCLVINYETPPKYDYYKFA